MRPGHWAKSSKTFLAVRDTRVLLAISCATHSCTREYHSAGLCSCRQSAFRLEIRAPTFLYGHRMVVSLVPSASTNSPSPR
jgi:hypothetical protein